MRIVWLAEKPSFRAASCWSVEVVKGGGGLRVAGFVSTDATDEAAFLDSLLRGERGAFVADRQAIELVALILDEASQERRAVLLHIGGDRPIFLRAGSFRSRARDRR